MKFKTLVAFFATLICVSVNAQTLYIEYDNDCMDRLEYRYAKAPQDYSHIVYHIRLNAQEKVILEVGLEERINKPTAPKGLKTCRDLNINDRTVQDINNGVLDVYIVRKEGKSFNISPVGIASFNRIDENRMTFQGIDGRFSYNFKDPASKRNLSTTSEAVVHFKGKLSHDCPQQLLFEKNRRNASSKYTEMVVIPEVGIVEEKTGFNKVDAGNNVLQLVKVNTIQYKDYLNSFCQGKGLSYQYDGKFFGDGFIRSEETTTTSTAVSALEGTRPTQPSSTTRFYPSGTTSQSSGTTTTNTGSTTTYIPSSTFTYYNPGDQCPNIYKDIDRGVYMDRITGQPATITCGNVTYQNGVRIEGGVILTSTTAPPPPVINVVNTTPEAVELASRGNTAEPVVIAEAPNNGCPEVSGGGYHIVQNNETLFGISRLYGIPVSQIQSWNPQIKKNIIHQCDKLQVRQTMTEDIPAAVALTDKGTAASAATTDVHIVRSGETLYSLSKKYGVSIDQISSLNNLADVSSIYPGMMLKLKAPEVADTTPKGLPLTYETTGTRIITEEVPVSRPVTKRRVHIVKDNETMYSISRQYNLTVEQLRSLNNMEASEVIIPFQRLYID